MRSSHSGVAIAQLIAVLVMCAIRGELRIQRVEETNNRLAAFPDRVVGHELDWPAIEIWRVVTPRSSSSEAGNSNAEDLEKHPPLWRFVKFTHHQGEEATPNEQTAGPERDLTKTLPLIKGSSSVRRSVIERDWLISPVGGLLRPKHLIRGWIGKATVTQSGFEQWLRGFPMPCMGWLISFFRIRRAGISQSSWL